MPRTLLCKIAPAALLALLLPACNSDHSATPVPATPAASAPQEAPPTPVDFASTTLTLKGKPFTIEIADTDEKTQRGLMFRNSMPDDHGMLFTFPKPQLLEFWMHNTRIPLDIVFLDQTGRVVDIEPRRPFDDTARGPGIPTQFVIELNVGTAEKIGLARGDVIDLPKK